MWPWRSMLTAPGFGSSFGTRASGSVQRSRATCSSAFARATAAPRASTAALASASGSCVTWSSCTAGRSQPRAEARISDRRSPSTCHSEPLTARLRGTRGHDDGADPARHQGAGRRRRSARARFHSHNARTIRRHGGHSGVRARSAGSLYQAAARCARQRPLMPGEDGLDLIRKIRALEASTGRHTPAAALTALARSDDRRRALSAGFEMHVAKPVDPLELASAVEQLVHQ